MPDGHQSEPQGPTLVVVSVGTIAALASLWSLTQFLLFVQPFWLSHLPPWALWLGRVFFILLILVIGFIVLYRGSGSSFIARVRRVVGAHPGWACVPLALFSLVLLGIGYLKRDIPETEIAQKLLSERGMSFSFDSLQNQMYLLNSDGVELFIRAGLQPDSLFDALGRQARLTGRDPLITRVIDNINSISDTERREKTVDRFIDLVSQATRKHDEDAKGDLDRLITIVDETVWGREVPLAGVSKTLLGFALSQGSVDLATALLRAGASPFEAGFDPTATPADIYVFDPFLYVWERSRAKEHWAGQPEAIYQALGDCGFKPSKYAESRDSELHAYLEQGEDANILCDNSLNGDWHPREEIWNGTASWRINESPDRCEVSELNLQISQERPLGDAAVVEGRVHSTSDSGQQDAIFVKMPVAGMGTALLYRIDQKRSEFNHFQGERHPDFLIMHNNTGAWHFSMNKTDTRSYDATELPLTEIGLKRQDGKLRSGETSSLETRSESSIMPKIEMVMDKLDAGSPERVYTLSILSGQTIGIRVEDHEADLCVTLITDDVLPDKDDGPSLAGWRVPAGQSWELPAQNWDAGNYKVHVQSMAQLSQFKIGAWTRPHPQPELTSEQAMINPWPNEPFDVSERIWAEEEHYYAIDLEQPVQFTVELTELSSDVDVELTDIDGEIYQISDNPGTEDERISLLVEPGLYIVRLYLWEFANGDSASYRLRANISPPS